MTPVFEMMEKVGVRYLYRLSGSFVPPEGGVVHILSEADRKAMRRLERNATWLIALAGAISAGIAVLAELTVLPLPEGQELGLQPEVLRHYGWVWGITLLATILEIAYIYYESLRATYRLAEIAGLDLFPDGKPESATAHFLVRAAMELPNPPATDLGLDHQKESSKLMILLAAVVYKIKIFGTNLIARLLLRKLAGRVVARVWLELIAIPITAAWNYVVARIVLKDALVRALGPSLAQEFINDLKSRLPEISLAGREAMLQAVGASLVRTADPHPNLVMLFKMLAENLDIDPHSETEFDSSQAFFDNLRQLNRVEQNYALKVLEMATILDGRIRRRERYLLKRAFAICDRVWDEAHLKALRKSFADGYPILDRL